MDQVAQELQQAYPALQIQLLGVNEEGQEPGNGSITDGRNLPWLQDGDVDENGKSDVWQDLWNVTFRDVVILDGQNSQVDVYNVTQHDLSDPNNYAAFRQLLIDAAMQDQKPWQNPADALDVDASGYVSARDVLFIVNLLNAQGSQQLGPPTIAEVQAPFYDCNGDSNITPSDALQVINYINNRAVQGEGEGAALAASPPRLVSQPPTSAAAAEESTPNRNQPASIASQNHPEDAFASASEAAPATDFVPQDPDDHAPEVDAYFSNLGTLKQVPKI